VIVCITSSAEVGGGGAAEFGAPSPATRPRLDLGMRHRWRDDRLVGQSGFEEGNNIFFVTSFEGLRGDGCAEGCQPAAGV